jgi:hypothetical protein
MRTWIFSAGIIVPDSSMKQCAADRTSFLEMSDPPQKDLGNFSMLVFINFLFMMAAWKGKVFFLALLPLEILVVI